DGGHEDDVLQRGAQGVGVFHGAAAHFDDCNLVAEGSDVAERFDEGFGLADRGVHRCWPTKSKRHCRPPAGGVNGVTLRFPRRLREPARSFVASGGRQDPRLPFVARGSKGMDRLAPAHPLSRWRTVVEQAKDMDNAPIERVLRQVGGIAAREGLADATDGQLLERFSAQQEEAAFAALLHRHGPMVLGVARRVLRQQQDAEDVLQATFLVLARKAGSIRKRESVASWLHGVAYRLAVEAPNQRARRLAHERQAGTMRHKRTNREGAWQELEEALDQALSSLPEKYREAVVLCCLEGKTQEEAARQACCPLGTVRSRLARGRELLRKQLARRGVTLSTGALATFLAASAAPTALPAAVLRDIVRASLQTAPGQAAAGIVSPRVAALAEGVTNAVGMTKAKSVVALLVTVAVLAGAGVCARQALSANNAEGDKPGAKPEARNHNPTI